jgi:hypothetical protein
MSKAPPFLPAAQTYFDRVVTNGGSLTANEKTYINTFIGALGTDFIEFDRLWIFGLSDLVAARTSIANPTSTMITLVNSPTFTANEGFNADGAVRYFNTNFNANTQGVKYTLNNASYGIYSRTNSIISLISDMGAASATASTIIQIRRESAEFKTTINDAAQSITANSNSQGFYAVSRVSTTKKLFKNGATLLTATQSSVSVPSFNIYIGGFNNVGSPSLTSSRQYSACFFGSGAINQSTFYTALQALGTSIGWQV